MDPFYFVFCLLFSFLLWGTIFAKLSSKKEVLFFGHFHASGPIRFWSRDRRASCPGARLAYSETRYMKYISIDRRKSRLSLERWIVNWLEFIVAQPLNDFMTSLRDWIPKNRKISKKFWKQTWETRRMSESPAGERP